MSSRLVESIGRETVSDCQYCLIDSVGMPFIVFGAIALAFHLATALSIVEPWQVSLHAIYRICCCFTSKVVTFGFIIDAGCSSALAGSLAGCYTARHMSISSGGCVLTSLCKYQVFHSDYTGSPGCARCLGLYCVQPPHERSVTSSQLTRSVR